MPASAGALIDRAGLKGHRVGGAAISATHANFIVNDGRRRPATSARWSKRLARAVRDKFGVELQDEVVFLGTF